MLPSSRISVTPQPTAGTQSLFTANEWRRYTRDRSYPRERE
jgi:hypothetical protein